MCDTYDPIEALRRQDTKALEIVFGPDWMEGLARYFSGYDEDLREEAYAEGYNDGERTSDKALDDEWNAGFDKAVEDMRNGLIPEGYTPRAHLRT